jgi:hypothetical protein
LNLFDCIDDSFLDWLDFDEPLFGEPEDQGALAPPAKQQK